MKQAMCLVCASLQTIAHCGRFAGWFRPDLALCNWSCRIHSSKRQARALACGFRSHATPVSGSERPGASRIWDRRCIRQRLPLAGRCVIRAHTFSKSATRCMPGLLHRWPRSLPQADVPVRSRRETAEPLYSVPMTSATPAMRLPAIHHAYFRPSSGWMNHTCYLCGWDNTITFWMCVNVCRLLYGPHVCGD